LAATETETETEMETVTGRLARQLLPRTTVRKDRKDDSANQLKAFLDVSRVAMRGQPGRMNDRPARSWSAMGRSLPWRAAAS